MAAEDYMERDDLDAFDDELVRLATSAAQAESHFFLGPHRDGSRFVALAAPPSHVNCRSVTEPESFCCRCGSRIVDLHFVRKIEPSTGLFIYTCLVCHNKKRKPAMNESSILGAVMFEQRRMRTNMILTAGQECWILWNPDSDRPPRIAYSTEAEAWRVAEELARKHVGQKFYVMHSCGHAVTSQPVVRIAPIKALTEKEVKHITRKMPAAKKPAAKRKTAVKKTRR